MAITESTINSLEFQSKLTGELDKALVQSAQTSFFADNAMRSKFVGARTVLIPDVDMQGLGNYDRDNGFVTGALTVSSTAYTMAMDRGRSFQLDREDNDETGIANLAGQVMGEFIRTKVSPEMDAYVLSKLATLATTKSHTVTGTPSSQVYKMITEAINKVQAVAGYDEELVCFVDSEVWSATMNTTELSRQLMVSDFRKGEINTKVKKLNDVPIIPVADDRMKTAYTFYDGVTDNSGSSGADQRPGGFVPASGAKKIGILVLPKRAASLVKKTEKVRIFEPDKNLRADAWKFDYRLYYDLFVKKSLQDTIYAYTR
jgi:hypothetical protein|nr:MAG TPA: major capsid protein [Caudoviricetes sp.]